MIKPIYIRKVVYAALGTSCVFSFTHIRPNKSDFNTYSHLKSDVLGTWYLGGRFIHTYYHLTKVTLLPNNIMKVLYRAYSIKLSKLPHMIKKHPAVTTRDDDAGNDFGAFW